MLPVILLLKPITGELGHHGNTYRLSKILSFAWKLWILSLATQSANCFTWRSRLHLILRKCLPIIPVWITTVHLSVSLLSKDGVPWKNTGYVSLLLNHIRAFPWDSHHTLGFSGGAFCAPRLVTGNIKKTLLKGQDLIKLFFFCFSKHIVKWNGRLRASLWVCSSGEYDDCQQSLLPLPRFVSRTRHSSHRCF